MLIFLNLNFLVRNVPEPLLSFFATVKIIAIQELSTAMTVPFIFITSVAQTIVS